MASLINSVPLIRIRFFTTAPLPLLRAWLPLAPGSTFADVAKDIRTMLPGRPEIEIELMGFALLPTSPCAMLDPANDVLEIKAARLAPASTSTATTIVAQPNLGEGTNNNIVPSITRANSGSSSSSSSSSSSDSDADSSNSSDSSDDEGSAAPRPISSKRPPNTAANHLQRPAKRARSTSSSSSSETSSSSDSDSSKSTSSSSSVSRSTRVGTKTASASASAKPTKINSVAHVPEGQGLKRTQKRNRRRRLLRNDKSREASASTNASHAATSSVPQSSEGTELSKVSPAITVEQPPASAAMSTNLVSIPPEAAPPLPTTTKPTPSTKIALDPYADLHGPKLNMLHLATGNKNKKKHIRLSASSSASTAPKRIFFDDPQRTIAVEGELVIEAPTGWASRPGARGKSDSPVSPRYEPGSPPLIHARAAQQSTPAAPRSRTVTAKTSTPAPSTPFARSKAVTNGVSSISTPKVAHLPPSQRSDLPPNLVITSVDVEGTNWQPSPGEIVPETSSQWTRWPEPTPIGIFDREGEKNSEGWPTWEQVDGMMNDGSLKVLKKEDAKKGLRIATRILELDPLTFSPTVALKYGRFLSYEDGLLSIELHPDCLPFSNDHEEEWGEEGEETYDVGFSGIREARPKFGQGVEMQVEESAHVVGGVWEGDWGDVRVLV
ncbi:BZ3500_MvSof-1268-A1-R1_Chr7-2g09510 [Microbotryum saponariae]|uniref:BZ3500_MvSof-1268-A1-R1_Chr7-2g09510 protein n=1 Tax=Microbotryum saponariae TaxID=289078 RepID=A0A2X0M0Q1_9BASI|nr:BZ3501_MvSof-1269-A2-R1_Chr7-1g09210 [Microbotryum saponariae]SDA02595.1 BZ3500_MvSof-1268-A1-R1_Chr7-2g09510 [Microbotryum saponariae]